MKVIKHLCLLLLATLLLAGLVLLLNSCNIVKAKKSVKADSTRVARIDTGHTVSNVTSLKNDSAWHREIIYFGKDTVTNNYYTTPAVIYRESGKQSKQADASNVESAWKKANDSAVVTNTVVTKEKKEEALNVWQIMALAGGVALAVVLVSKLKITFK